MPDRGAPEEAISKVFEEAGVRYRLEPPRPREPSGFRVYLPKDKATLLLEYFPALAPHQVEGIALGLRRKQAAGVRTGVIVRRLSRPLLQACKNHGMPVLDLEGNGWLQVPGLFIERFRPARPPGGEGASGSVFTAKASRAVRALLASYPENWTQTALRVATGLSRGFMSVLWGRLQKEGYASIRGRAMRLESPDRLLDDWRAHYRFDRHRRLFFALNMDSYEEGLEKTSVRLRESGVKFAFTGWSGGYLRSPYAVPSTIMAYVAREPFGLEGLFPVERQGNVVLLLPNEEGVFQFSRASSLGPVVSDPQLYVDLCRMPGRAQDQADALRHQHLRFAEDTP